MNMFSLAKRYTTSSLPTTLLQVLTFASGMAILLIVLSISSQIKSSFSQGSNKIDVIIGAKGSPLQLVLSGIYHADIPTGNIDYNQAIRLSKHKSIKTATPISLGDNYKGYRIVGTNEDFLRLYKAQLKEGNILSSSMEAIIGYNIAKKEGLKIGDNFVGSHGIVQGGEEHGNKPYEVVGILEKSGNISDRLILTSLESVWEVHGDHDHSNHEHDHNKHKDEHEHNDHENHHDEHGHEHENHKHDHEKEDEDYDHSHKKHQKKANKDKEVTALLVQYKNRAAAINFPRMVNKQTNMQAASPNFQMVRLFKMLGVGFDTAKIIGYVLLSISILSIFLVLLSNIRKRHHDMAILRVFGATPSKIMKLVLFEGLILSSLGTILGLIFSRAILLIIDDIIMDGNGISLQASTLTQEEIFVMILVLIISLLASIIPALMSYRVNISDLLLNRK